MVDFAKLMQQKKIDLAVQNPVTVKADKTVDNAQPTGTGYKPAFTIPGKPAVTVPLSTPASSGAGVPAATVGSVAPTVVQSTPVITSQQFQYPTQPDLMGKDDAAQFQANLGMLRESFMHKDLIAPVIRRILTDLDNHPEYKEFLAPTDCGLMVRMLRESYGIMVQVAQGKKRTKKPDKELSVDIGDLAAMVVDL